MALWRRGLGTERKNVGGQENIRWVGRMKRVLSHCPEKVGRTVNLKSKKWLNCSEEGTLAL
jgi:hypothetical protein